MTENIFPYELPENWHWTTLEKVCEYIRAGGDKPKDFSEQKTKICHVPVVANGVNNDGIIGYTSKAKEKSGTITISGRGTIGYAVLRNYEYYPVVRVLILSTNKKIFLQYLKYLIDFSSLNGIGSSIPQLTIPMLKNFPVPLPPMDEQKKMVERIESLFSKLDAAKSIVQKILDGYELRRAAILHKAFTGELSKNFRAENNLSLDDWQEKTLGEVCKINPPKISTANLSDDLEVSFFPMTSLSETEGKITNPQIKFLGEVKSGYTNFSEGDVVFAKITPCMENGKSAVIEKLVNDIGYGTTEFFVLRCNKEIFNRFLYHLVRSKKFRTEAQEVMAGAVGQQRVPKKFLSEYKISLPPPAEQKEIVRVLDSLLDKEQRTQEIAEKILQEIDLLKKSVLARAFRGEL